MIKKFQDTLQVKHADLDDSNNIFQLANSVKINYKKPQKEGFLVYVLSKEKYRERIEVTKYFYVIEKEGKILGFLMCYDNSTLKKIYKQGSISHEDVIIDFVLEQDEPYIFGDQIAVDLNSSMQGFGKLIMDKLFEDMVSRKIPVVYVGILHEPVKNTASFNFCKKLGFNMVTKVKNKDNLVWGIYKLEVK